MQRKAEHTETPSSRKIAYARELNASQLEAVRFQEGPVLVIAGAGSGKTRTLTYRVARLVEDGNPPNSILLLTFTRKAAQQMLQRSVDLLDSRCGQVAGGTFHSFANTVLRRYGSRLGYTGNYCILDRTDCETIIALLRPEVHPVSTVRKFPTKRTLANIFSKAANKGVFVEEIILDDYRHFEPEIGPISQLHHLYDRHKSEHMFFDYDDLLVKLKELLATHDDVRRRIQEQYRFIMVDEYQDTNRIQAEILRLLAGNRQNIMAVGDDSQSIYSFRGANFENIMNFPETFPGSRIIRLEENYRSTSPILTLTNAILDRASQKFSKHLYTRRQGGVTPVLVHTADENDQSAYVVGQIKNAVNDGVPLRDIAVLFRAGFHAFDLEIELNREGLPFVKVGGFKFMESAHIKDVLAHLRILVNPLDRISWYRILNLVDRIGPKSAARIYEAIQAERDVSSALSGLKLSPNQTQAMAPIKALFAELAPDTMTVAQLGQAVVGYYAEILKKTYDDHPKRMRDLEQLVRIMERYPALDPFLADMALEPPTSAIDDGMAPEADTADRLVLSTVHSAKGLEWHTVFVIWALDGRFPSVQAMEKEADVEEELRLMYVAATRARENLFFTCPGPVFDRSAQSYLSRPSRFISGMPDDVLDNQYLGTQSWSFDD